MDKRNDSPKESDSADAGNPQQFRLMDLFVLTTLVALLSAMVAPLLRGLESDYRNLLLRIVGFQLLLAAGTIVYYAKQRKKLLDKSGSRIGSAFCGQFRWRYWPIVRTVSSIVFAASFQLLFAAAMAITILDSGQIFGPISMMIDRLPVSYRVLHYLHYLSFLDFFFYLQYSFSVGYAFSLYRWRAYPNTLEFFEHGIVKKGLSFIPWKRIEVRPSTFFDDKIAIVVRASPLAIEDRPSPDSLDSKDAARGSLDTVAGTIIMAQVKGELRERVFAVANAAHTTNQGNGA